MTPLRSSLLILGSLLAAASQSRASVSVAVINPSFEADTFGTFPGYLGGGNPTAITGWATTGGVGINGDDIGAGAPFINGGVVDGHRAGFIQGGGSFSQNLSGLTPGARYVMQGVAIARNCCGDVPNISVTVGGTPLIAGTFPITTWTPFSLPFTSAGSSAILGINSAPSAGGDASMGLDAIHLLQLAPNELPLFNPNFEAGGTTLAFPGYTSGIAGWNKTGSGSTGYNYAGNSPFADNGVYPEGQTIAFLQNDVTLSQNLTGLTVGQQYMLDFYYNSRNDGDNAWALAKLNGVTILNTDVNPVGGANTWHHFSQTFTATSASLPFSIQNDTSHGQSDASLLLDAFRLQSVPEPSALGLAALGLTALRRRKK
jgi:Protein of unknown function (DUF642)/PEP-CTERM motif